MKKYSTITQLFQTLAVLVCMIGFTIFAAPALHAQADYSCGAYGASSYSENCGGSSANSKNKTDGCLLSKTGQQRLIYILLGILCVAGSFTLYKITSKKSRS